MFAFPILFRFGLLAFVGATVASVANSKKRLCFARWCFSVGSWSPRSSPRFLWCLNPGDEPCLASEATPLEAGFAAPSGANQLESDGEIGGLLLGEFNLGQAGACGIELFGTGQNKGNKR